MGFSEDAVAMALSMGLETTEDAMQWLLDHPEAGSTVEPTAEEVDDEEALLHYAIAESVLQRQKDDALTADERRLAPRPRGTAPLGRKPSFGAGSLEGPAVQKSPRDRRTISR